MSRTRIPSVDGSARKHVDYDETNGPAIADVFAGTPRDDERRALLRRLEQVEKLFDRNYSFLGIRFGYDAILGLVPVLGDTVAAGVAACIFWKAQKLGVPGHLKTRMVSNIAFDYIFGAIPVVGTIVDVAFKANTRNVRLLKEHLLEEQEREGRG
jgi:hypothetical protein